MEKYFWAGSDFVYAVHSYNLKALIFSKLFSHQTERSSSGAPGEFSVHRYRRSHELGLQARCRWCCQRCCLPRGTGRAGRGWAGHRKKERTPRDQQSSCSECKPAECPLRAGCCFHFSPVVFPCIMNTPKINAEYFPLFIIFFSIFQNWLYL